MTLAELLVWDGYQAFQAKNLASAILQIDSVENLAAVLVDLNMRGWKEIAGHVAEMTHAPVIAMAGNCSVDKQELKKRGISVCLQKPIVYDQVRESIDQLRYQAAANLI